MFSKSFQRKYALTDQGVKNTKKGAFWTVIVNLVVMDGMGILYLLMYGLMGTLTDGAPLPGPALFLGLVIAFVILSFVTHLQQYHATYGLVYNEVKSTRLSLAERLRKLPLGYFGKRDLADLTETLMGDVNRMEHVWSHVLGYLYGAYISTAIIAVCLLVYDWRLTIACLWGVPAAFGLLHIGEQEDQYDPKPPEGEYPNQQPSLPRSAHQSHDGDNSTNQNGDAAAQKSFVVTHFFAVLPVNFA